VTAQVDGASPTFPTSLLVPQREARRRLRALRAAIPQPERLAANRAIRAELRRLRIWRPGLRVAVFLGLPDEVDLRPCFDAAWRRGVRLYVPRILSLRRGALAFVPFERDGRLQRNWFGIDEPVTTLHRRVTARQLDVIVTPLLGFDAQCHRLGMGAGFYDRALRTRLDHARTFRRPRLVGVAFAIQRVERIEPSPWDVALDMVVTEHGVFRRPLHPQTGPRA
jgi:5-formyltetrahydrofolate cyclo-ligase